MYNGGVVRLHIENVRSNTKYSSIAYYVTLVGLIALYYMYLVGVDLFILKSYKDLFLFIVSLSVFLTHLILYVSCEKVVKRFELLRLLIKHRDCTFSESLDDELTTCNIFLVILIYIDILILIFYIVRCYYFV